MNFFEQVALMKQSSLIQENVVFYTWGYEIMQAFNDKSFWSGMGEGKDDRFWRLFNVLAVRMNALDGTYPKQIPVEKFHF